ncbi:hypothetical protein FHN55_10185 [Streptomyces sp. NP160]|uniref:hypothetical protein n=1 Tax=Streptomyces sp. NP160 TaxID=2586637 RepID=UPI001117C597|nr:hypothetical protein [Streptomyces sp. NP160]TNM67419.1 hypothetical protein FHN55_10185 [Streptomyces sp. NP160]
MAARSRTSSTPEAVDTAAREAGREGAGSVVQTHPPRWREPARLVRPLAVVLAVLLVVGPVVRLAVDAVTGDPSLPQAWLTEAARLVDLDAEGNLPTYFSSALLAATAAGLAAAAVLARARGWRAWPLAAPAAVAALLSVDELASLHEQMALLADLLGVDAGLRFSWVVPGVVVAAVVGTGLLLVARGMAPRLRWRLVVAGAVYLLGALVVETVTGGMFRPAPPGGLEPVQSTAYVLLNAVEEGLEMVGALLALRAVLLALRVAATPGGVVVDLDPDRPVLSQRARAAA